MVAWEERERGTWKGTKTDKKQQKQKHAARKTDRQTDEKEAPELNEPNPGVLLVAIAPPAVTLFAMRSDEWKRAYQGPKDPSRPLGRALRLAWIVKETCWYDLRYKFKVNFFRTFMEYDYSIDAAGKPGPAGKPTHPDSTTSRIKRATMPCKICGVSARPSSPRRFGPFFGAVLRPRAAAVHAL